MNARDILEVIRRARSLAHNRIFAKERISEEDFQKDESWLSERIEPDVKRMLLADLTLCHSAKKVSEILSKLQVNCKSCKWSGTLDAKGKMKRAENIKPMCPYPLIRNDTYWCPLYSPVNKSAAKVFDWMGKAREEVQEAVDALNNAAKEYYQVHSKTTNKGG